ncbi:MAG: GGDEF domain-containing protein [Fibrobacter sp.]|nr:GGDEF domain-containing protein [Fibrobacter sp.]
MTADASLHPEDPEYIEHLIQDNTNLAEQVKRLVRTEYALYNTQLELDNQMQLYKELYEAGKKLSSTNIDSLFYEAGSFITDRLNFGGFLVLERSNYLFRVKISGGCCSGSIVPNATTSFYKLFTDPEIIQQTGNDHIISATSGNSLLYDGIKTHCFFDKLVTHLFYIGTDKIPAYVLIVGNPVENEFYNDLIENSIHMIGLGSLVSLLKNALNNAFHYQELVKERELLEIKVQERTNDLNNALENLKSLNSKLEVLSFQDELTGLYNRRGFYIFGEKFFSMAKRKKTSLLIMYCDLDKFKLINDIYGHKEGDCALKTTASILKNTCRDYDIISRFGGDEFVILLDNIAIDEFEMLKERINRTFYDYNNLSNKGYQILISLGFTTYSPELDQSCTFDELIEQADKKLYAEKKKKKNR